MISWSPESNVRAWRLWAFVLWIFEACAFLSSTTPHHTTPPDYFQALKNFSESILIFLHCAGCWCRPSKCEVGIYHYIMDSPFNTFREYAHEFPHKNQCTTLLFPARLNGSEVSPRVYSFVSTVRVLIPVPFYSENSDKLHQAVTVLSNFFANIDHCCRHDHYCTQCGSVTPIVVVEGGVVFCFILPFPISHGYRTGW